MDSLIIKNIYTAFTSNRKFTLYHIV